MSATFHSRLPSRQEASRTLSHSPFAAINRAVHWHALTVVAVAEELTNASSRVTLTPGAHAIAIVGLSTAPLQVHLSWVTPEYRQAPDIALVVVGDEELYGRQELGCFSAGLFLLQGLLALRHGTLRHGRIHTLDNTCQRRLGSISFVELCDEDPEREAPSSADNCCTRL